jgi:hypothetical protein
MLKLLPPQWICTNLSDECSRWRILVSTEAIVAMPHCCPRHDDETKILLKSQPQFCARGADGGQRTGGGRFLPCGYRDKSRTKPRILTVVSRRCLLSGNSAAQRNRGQSRGKTAICDRLCCIRNCKQTWPQRGCCQNSGTYNRGCCQTVGTSSGAKPPLAARMIRSGKEHAFVMRIVQAEVGFLRCPLDLRLPLERPSAPRL